MAKNEIKSWNYGKKSAGSHVFDFINIVFMIFMIVITIYPFIYVLFASFSDPYQLMSHSGIMLRPQGFSIYGYKLVLKNSGVIQGYWVTIRVVIVGTVASMLVSLLFAYVMSREDLLWHGPITMIAVFTMYFSGGLIPTYLVVSGLGLIDTLASLILPGLLSTYNCIILRTAFRSVPAEMSESARLDGAGELTILVKILVPLIVPTIAAISLFYMVGYWNNWTNALIYIRTPSKYPLQLVLRGILINNDTTATSGTGSSYNSGEDLAASMLLKYSTIIVSIVPIVCVYPFLQKYFTKGVMIGAVKG